MGSFLFTNVKTCIQAYLFYNAVNLPNPCLSLSEPNKLHATVCCISQLECLLLWAEWSFRMGFSGKLEQPVPLTDKLPFSWGLTMWVLYLSTPPPKKPLTLEIFGIWPQYFYTVTIHIFITLCFMNSEGLLHCTQTSFNLFSWSNPLKQSVEVCAIKAGWFPFRKLSSMDTCSQWLVASWR